jgi:hypothetical protein
MDEDCPLKELDLEDPEILATKLPDPVDTPVSLREPEPEALAQSDDDDALPSARMPLISAETRLLSSQASSSAVPEQESRPVPQSMLARPHGRLWAVSAGVALFAGTVLLVSTTVTGGIHPFGNPRSEHWNENMLELEQHVRASSRGKLPKIRDIRSHPGEETTLRNEMEGKWCEAVQLDPHYGVIDFSNICPKRKLDIKVDDDSFPTVSPDLTKQQFAKVRSYLLWHPLNRENPTHWEALRALQHLSDFRAQDIFAFRETWTDEDTELLRRLDPQAWTWAPGNLTTESFRARLPSLRDLHELVKGERIAIVGGADSLSGAGLGPEIDSHAHVVRFNEIVGEKLIPEETGSKTTFHVSCSKVAPLEQPHVAEFDLETDTVWRSWCGRMHANGEFAGVTDRPYMIRPSAYCVLSQHNAKLWTRGFLFYWFIGRLFEEVNLYGFSGHGHYHNKNPIWEKYLDFEHLFYNVNDLNAH